MSVPTNDRAQELMALGVLKYRGWSVDYDPKPIPIRDFDWTATHPDYDASWEGDQEGWVDNSLKAAAGSYGELCEEIDALQDQWDGLNGQYGVGA